MASVRVPWAYVNTEMDAWIHVREEQCSGRIKRPSNRGHGRYCIRDVAGEKDRSGLHDFEDRVYSDHLKATLLVAAR